MKLKTLYLQRSFSHDEGRDALAGRRLLDHLKRHSDEYMLGHVVVADQDLPSLEPVRKELGPEIVTESALGGLDPNLIYLEGGLFGRVVPQWKIPRGLVEPLLERGAVMVVADVDHNRWINRSEHREACQFLGGCPIYNGRDEPVYCADDVNCHRGGWHEIICHTEQMVIDDWLRPVYEGVSSVLAGGPVKLRPEGGDILASTNRETSGTLQSDVWVDRRGDPAPFAVATKRRNGYVVLISAGVSADVWTEACPDNLGWILNLSRFLVEAADHDRARREDPVRSPHRVFLSHRHADKPVVEQVASELKQHGIGIWLDTERLVPSDSLPAEIARGLESMTHFCLFWSEHCPGSRWVEKELNVALALAMEKDMPTFVVRLDATDIPTLLKDRYRIEAAGMSPVEVAGALADAVRRLARRGRAGRPQPGGSGG